ncbi:MAG: hypothetical protein AAFV93_09560 [Chloroflexota bacterium]
MRLFDRIRINKLIHPDSEMPVIIADSIAKQIDGLPDNDTDDSPYTPKDIGRIAPPFPNFFVEATSKVIDMPGQVIQRGLLIADVTEKIISGDIKTNPQGNIPEGTKWVIAQRGFMYVPSMSGALFAPDLIVFSHIGEDGISLDDFNHLNVLAIPKTDEADYPTETMKELLLGMLPFGQKTISALHQRGDVEHVEQPRNFTRRLKRKYDIKATDYYILAIKQNKPKKIQDVGLGDSTRSDSKKREHWVRGHFREVEGHPFIPDGLYFVKPHQRGKSASGTIRKDYRIISD